MSGISDAAVRLGYEGKLYLRAGVWVALALGLLVPWAVWLPAGGPAAREGALAAMELFTVIGVPLLAGSVLCRDHEDGSAEILLSRPASRGRLLGWRLLPALAATAALIGLSAVGYGLRGVEIPPADIVVTVGPTALFLGALAVAVGTLTRLSAPAYLVPVAYWVFDWASKGEHTGYLTLFGRGAGAEGWLTGKAVLAAAAVALLGLAVIGATRRN